jgi:hypothetical protein
MQIHQRKLERIAGRNDQNSMSRLSSVIGSKAGRAVGKELMKFKLEKARSKDFRLSEKNLVISKDNQILLSKLVEISSGKRSCLP